MARLSLVDRIYESAAVPELWPDVLHKVGAVGGGLGATLITTSATQSLRWTSSPAMRDTLQAFVDGRWYETNSRLPRLLAKRHAGFLRDVDVYGSAQELAADPHVNKFFRPRGLGWVAGTAIPSITEDFIVISVEREYRRGPVEIEKLRALDALRPHLARAALLSARLGLQRVEAMVALLEIIQIPAAVLDQQGRCLATNPLFQAHIPARFRDDRVRLKCTSLSSDALLQQALLSIAAPGALSPWSFAVSTAASCVPVIAHLVPVRGAAQDIFVRAAALLVLSAVQHPAVAPADVISDLYDLTAAEARVAREIALGRRIKSIAKDGNVSPETVRSQLKAVLAKTGTSRQAELVGLLSSTKARSL